SSTTSVVAAVCVGFALLPVTVSDKAYGVALVVVFIVSMADPPPVIALGLKPPLVTPLGNPDSLATPRFTAPGKPLIGVTVTVKVADCQGNIVRAAGVTSIEKSAPAGRTVIFLVGGLGSVFPLPSLVVSDAR